MLDKISFHKHFNEQFLYFIVKNYFLCFAKICIVEGMGIKRYDMLPKTSSNIPNSYKLYWIENVLCMEMFDVFNCEMWCHLKCL